MPDSGLHFNQRIPEAVHRRDLNAKVRQRRICTDDRNYLPFQYTIPGVVTTGNYSPAMPVDKHYWVAGASAAVGRHDSGTHPNDGAPTGADMFFNFGVITRTGSSDTKLFVSDTEFTIAAGRHVDDKAFAAMVSPSPWLRNDLNFTQLTPGMSVYPKVLQVGSSNPGTNLVLTLYLIPVRTVETQETPF